MVTAATGRTMQDLYEQNLFGPLEMTSTRFSNPSNPPLGAGLTSTASDYFKFLRALYMKDAALLSPELIEEMEKDQYPEATRTALYASTFVLFAAFACNNVCP
jgi:CubicO group peptidase (beta-lactamase class C family)